MIYYFQSVQMCARKHASTQVARYETNLLQQQPNANSLFVNAILKFT